MTDIEIYYDKLFTSYKFNQAYNCTVTMKQNRYACYIDVIDLIGELA